MKALVHFLSGSVRRAPVVVLVTAVVVSMVLGGLGGDFFAQEEGGNDAFAPDAPEILAAERIGDLFGDDSGESVVQFIVSSESGDVIDTGGLETVRAVQQAVTAGALGDRLSERPERPAFISFMAPVEQAIQMGQVPEPTGDEELDAVFLRALEQAPPEQLGFVEQLLPADGDLAAAESPKGLVLAFVRGPRDTDEFDAFVELQGQMAEEIAELAVPDGYTVEPFSFELVFTTQDEFQSEVGRLFAAALFIILTILSIVFVVIPADPRRRAVAWGGFGVLVLAAGLLVLDILPLPVVGLVFVAVFATWTFTTPGLRRTTADVLLTIITIIFAINWVAGFWKLLYDEPNPMTQIIPILLIGLGVDYSIHLTSRYRDEVSSGKSVDDAIRMAIRTVGVALVLATVTTAVGFLTNITNDIRALQQFGVLSAIGIVASFLLMLTLVPAARELLDRRAERGERFDPDTLVGGESRALPRAIGRTSVLATRLPVATTIVALLLGVVGAFGVTQLEAKFSFLDFVPTTSPLRDTFETIIDDFGGGFGETTQVLIEGEVDGDDGWNAMAASLGNLADTPNVITFGGFPAAETPLTVIGDLANPESAGFDPAVGQAAQQVGLGSDLSVPAGSDVTPLFDAALAAAPQRIGRLVHPDGSGGYDAVQFDVQTQAGEAAAGELREDVNADFEPVREAGLTAVATSDEIINDVIVTTLRNSQVSSLFITLAAALALLVVNFLVESRRPFLGVVTTIPVVLVVLWAFGIMAAAGIPFGPVTATIAALAIGIGIPYMIHITHRYQEDRIRHRSADEAIHSTLTHTGGALAGSALTTMAGFGILVTSTTIPFQQLGFVTAYTIGLALVAGVLVLPSFLMLWDRWHQRRGEEAVDEAALHGALHDEVEDVLST